MLPVNDKHSVRAVLNHTLCTHVGLYFLVIFNKSTCKGLTMTFIQITIKPALQCENTRRRILLSRQVTANQLNKG